MTRVLVTGASGFIGTAVCIDALAKGWKVRGAVRSEWEHSIPPAEQLRYSVTFRTVVAR